MACYAVTIHVACTKLLGATGGRLSAILFQRAVWFSSARLKSDYPYISGFPPSLLISWLGEPHRFKEGALTSAILNSDHSSLSKERCHTKEISYSRCLFVFVFFLVPFSILSFYFFSCCIMPIHFCFPILFFCWDFTTLSHFQFICIVSVGFWRWDWALICILLLLVIESLSFLFITSALSIFNTKIKISSFVMHAFCFQGQGKWTAM